MKIINLRTNHIFNLPDVEAEGLISDFPDEFVKYTKGRKSKKPVENKENQSIVLSKILDE